MKRTFVRTEKGSYVVWKTHDGTIEGQTVNANFLETTGGITVLGWWSKEPTKEEVKSMLDMVAGYQ